MKEEREDAPHVGEAVPIIAGQSKKRAVIISWGSSRFSDGGEGWWWRA